jgi:hypothetical protein
MSQVIVGLFSSYRDAHEALRALQLLGLGRDDGHLYRTGQRDADLRFAGVRLLTKQNRRLRTAQSTWHTANIRGWWARPTDFAGWASTRPCALTRTSTLQATTLPRAHCLLSMHTTALKLTTVWEVLYEHGAMAVKDPNGHWRFSPYRTVCRSQE